MDFLTTEHCKALLPKLPKELNRFWHWFLFCTEIPRGSGNTTRMASELLRISKEFGWESKIDKAGNVIITKPASKGKEACKTICLQAHLDIVNQSERSDYNPLTDGVIPLIEGDFVRAKQTTLGADNGVGIAAALTILEDESISHPKIQFLCTNDEETTTSGASDLSSDELCPNTKYIINLDSEDKGMICLACAGSLDVVFSIPVKREKMENSCYYSLSVSGLRGGHSGCDIEKGYANAFKVLCSILLSSKCRLCSMDGGSAMNAIPREAKAIVCVEKSQVSEFCDKVKKAFEIFKTEFSSIEKQCKIECSEISQSELLPLTEETTKRILFGWTLLPSCPLRISPETKELVETSFATTVMKTTETEIVISALARTSRESQFSEIERISKALAFFLQADVKIEGKLPAWNYLETELSKAAEEVYEKLSGKKPIKYGVHAFLECGLIVEKYPKANAISIGPQVNNAHSCEEEVEISSCVEFYKWVKGIIETLP